MNPSQQATDSEVWSYFHTQWQARLQSCVNLRSPSSVAWACLFIRRWRRWLAGWISWALYSELMSHPVLVDANFEPKCLYHANNQDDAWVVTVCVCFLWSQEQHCATLCSTKSSRFLNSLSKQIELCTGGGFPGSTWIYSRCNCVVAFCDAALSLLNFVVL